MSSRKISLASLFIALSVIGSFIKIPGPVGSVALDSFPALVAGGLLGGGIGAIVGGIGHLASAYFVGMPMGFLHLLIAIEMAVCIFVFTKIYQKGNRVLAIIVFLVGNVFLAPLPFIPMFGFPFYIALVPSLLISSLMNSVVAYLLLPRLDNMLHREVAK